MNFIKLLGEKEFKFLSQEKGICQKKLLRLEIRKEVKTIDEIENTSTL